MKKLHKFSVSGRGRDSYFKTCCISNLLFCSKTSLLKFFKNLEPQEKVRFLNVTGDSFVKKKSAMLLKFIKAIKL